MVRRIDEAMAADRRRLRDELEAIARATNERDASNRGTRRGEPAEEGTGESTSGRTAAGAGRFGRRWAAWLRKLEASIGVRKARQSHIPVIDYDPALPITAHRQRIAAAIAAHPVVIVCGETGSGKSTQLPKMCLELGRGAAGMIGHTQPRRIAARSIAARVAQELRVPLGREVGFKVRFTDATSPDTLVKLMTDGVLLAESQHDRFFEHYDTIILDEAHERSLNVDFLIGYLKRLLPRRRDLKLVITSATIDAARFAAHFGGPSGPAPVIEVAGRGYPVEIRYRPLVAEQPPPNDTAQPEPVEPAPPPVSAPSSPAAAGRASARRRRDAAAARAAEAADVDWLDGVLAAVDELARIDRGDMLIFMPTERDIHETAKALRAHPIPGDRPDRPSLILPLYARLSAREQQRVFEPAGRRKIVIATNVAESSLTVPGVRFVIDPGTARLSRYSARSRTQRLPIEPISRASADQRAGRCGRVGPGICVRLYSQADYLARERFTPPEIQRANLAAVILQTKALRLGPIESFPLLDPPRRDAVRDGYNTLVELGAIDARRELTPLGRQLSRLPVDPRIGRMILAAHDEGCLADVLIIAAALETQDPRLRPADDPEPADAAHAAFVHEGSDFLSYLKLWDFLDHLKRTLSRGQLRKACQQNYLSYNRWREWFDVYLQLRELVAEAGIAPGARRGDEAAIHRAILTGLLSNIACRGEGHEYQTAGGGRAFVWPGSAVFKAKPRWIVAAEIIETTRRYLRTTARIEPEWLETLGAHLVKRSYAEPHWDPAAAAAMTFERVTLFGLPVVPRRRVALGQIEPALARELMIREGLVEGRWERPPRWLADNLATAQRVEKLEHKLRRTGLRRGDEALYEFYDRRVPSEATDGAQLARWLRDQGEGGAEALRLRESDLLVDPSLAQRESLYPDQLDVGGNPLPLDYRFEPGTPRDGVTLRVPIEALHQLSGRQLGWLVPGLLEAKLVALMKTLPKPLRERIVPLAETARAIVAQLHFGEGDLEAQLAAALSRRVGAAIPAAAFDAARLPDELRMNIEVVDAAGKTVAAGREIGALRRALAIESADAVDRVEDSRWRRDGITSWDFGSLEPEVETVAGGLRLRAYPMLVDQGASVGLRLSNDAGRAERESRAGVRRLCALAAAAELCEQVRHFPRLEEMSLHGAAIPGFRLHDELTLLIADRAFTAERPSPRTPEEFRETLRAGRRAIGRAVQEVAEVVPGLLAAHHRARLALERIKAARFQYAAEDVRRQMDRLVAPGFLTATAWTWLVHFPRYFAAIEYRIERLGAGAAERDRRATDVVAQWWNRYAARAEEHGEAGVFDPELERLRWMIEEFRVQSFAEPLGTSLSVSAKRLERQWEKTRS